ncbi:MAG: hypothetical protein HKN70_04145 [Gammaproteobacteria bacterium]|nr:hypothetical protein [Gammaproteobacteria bacterium]
MSENEVLSKAEVGALLTGVADGVVATNSGVIASGEVTPFEFKSSYKVSSYCPAALVNIYSKVARNLQAGLYDLLHREVEVELEGLRRHRYDEYLATLEKPVCVHSITEKSLPGTALIVLDAALIYAFVEKYFGGGGEPAITSSERDLTPAEVRMSGMLLEMILAKLTLAWSPVDDLVFSSQGFETDPAMVTVAAHPESMLVVKMRVNLAGTTGDCQVAMPLSMLEPVRTKLEASGQGSLRERERFHRSMRQQLRKVRITLRGDLCEVPLTLREMLNLTPGDVIPVDLPGNVELRVDDAPVLYGRFGTARGMNAVCMVGRTTKDDQNPSSNEAKS